MSRMESIINLDNSRWMYFTFKFSTARMYLILCKNKSPKILYVREAIAFENQMQNNRKWTQLSFSFISYIITRCIWAHQNPSPVNFERKICAIKKSMKIESKKKEVTLCYVRFGGYFTKKSKTAHHFMRKWAFKKHPKRITRLATASVFIEFICTTVRDSKNISTKKSIWKRADSLGLSVWAYAIEMPATFRLLDIFSWMCRSCESLPYIMYSSTEKWIWL